MLQPLGLVLLSQLLLPQGGLAQEPPVAQGVAAKDSTRQEPTPTKDTTPQEPAPTKDTAPQEPTIPAPQAPAEASVAEAPKPGEKLYSMVLHNKEADDILITFAKRAGIEIAFLSPAVEMLTLSFHNLPVEKALGLICDRAGLAFRKKDGVYNIGLPMDLRVYFPEADDSQPMDAVYRCRHLDANSLANALTDALPSELKAKIGPRYLSPVLADGDPSGASGELGVRALGATELGFKVHNVVLTGPADLVRRALMLARKFDAPRKQVRINIRIAEVQTNSDRNLGMSWMQDLKMISTEQTKSGATSVEGIRLGKFSHTPLAVNATLNALEHEGKAKTLSNPTLLLMDGERSFILSGQKYFYPKYMGQDFAGLPKYDMGEVKVGIYLQVSVHLGMNKDVLMSIIPQVTNITDFKSFATGSLPIINTREAQTTVHAYTGEMIVLGGLQQDIQTEASDGLPFLRRIPILGRLFSNSKKMRTKSELMIFLTPEIVDDIDHVEDMHVEVSE